MKKNLLRYYFLRPGGLLAVVSCCTVVFCAACGFAAQYSLVTDHENVPPEIEAKMKADKGVFASAKRALKVELTDAILSSETLSTNDVLVLNLFDDVRYRADIERISKDAQDVIRISARLATFESGYVVITSAVDRILVTIRIPDQNQHYAIVYEPETEAYYLLDIDPSKRDAKPEGPVLIPPDTGGDDAAEEP